MRFQAQPARQVNRPRRDVIDRGLPIVAERGEVWPLAEQPALRRERRQPHASGQQVGQFLQERAIIRPRRIVGLRHRRLLICHDRTRPRHGNAGRCRWRRFGRGRGPVDQRGAPIAGRQLPAKLAPCILQPQLERGGSEPIRGRRGGADVWRRSADAWGGGADAWRGHRRKTIVERAERRACRKRRRRERCLVRIGNPGRSAKRDGKRGKAKRNSFGPLEAATCQQRLNSSCVGSHQVQKSPLPALGAPTPR